MEKLLYFFLFHFVVFAFQCLHGRAPFSSMRSCLYVLTELAKPIRYLLGKRSVHAVFQIHVLEKRAPDTLFVLYFVLYYTLRNIFPDRI